MFNATKAKNATRKVSVTYGDDTFDVWYYPNRFTTKMLREVNKAEDLSQNAEMATAIIAKWDIGETVTDEDGNEIQQQYPVTKEVAEELGIFVMAAIFDAIKAEMAPGETTGN